MSTASRPAGSASTTTQPGEKTFFEQQREALLKEISLSFEHVLANINKLNRSLEGVIAVGNEFSSVEALWSQFENVMAKDPDADNEVQNAEEGSDNEREDELVVEEERAPRR
ncbi:DASH complex subunit Dad1 [Bisporella sp. PMI_857]|nr:DASH complex subunit Dad1 [Bisporella sp. PMI_857]